MMTYIPLVLSFTPDYLVPAAVTLLSILDSSHKSDKFEVICLLSEKLSLEKRESLVMLDPERLKFTFLNLEDQLNNIYIDNRYSVAASYRLLLPDLLPNHDTVIYLDCDIIVRNNLANLYRNTDLEKHYLAAVIEASLSFQISYIEALGLVAGEYFNSGFLIMNLEKMRTDNLTRLLIEKSDNPASNFPDQDALNIICKGKILPLSPIFNSIRTYFLPQFKRDFLKYYTSKEWDDVQDQGNIHYTGGKPWNGHTIKFEYWWKYYEVLPVPLKKLWKVSLKMSLLYTFFKFRFGVFVYNKLQNMYRKL